MQKENHKEKLVPLKLEDLIKGMTPENCHAELIAEPLDSELPEYK